MMGYTLMSNREVIATAQCDDCEAMTCDCILDLALPVASGRQFQRPSNVDAEAGQGER